MKKGQYLSEVSLNEGESLLDYINAAMAMCKEEHSPDEIEVHQIIAVGENKFVILINYYHTVNVVL